MKKVNFILFVFSLVLVVESAVAQQDLAMISSSSLGLALGEDYLFVFSEESEVESNFNTAKVNDAKVLEVDYDSKVEENFGAYLNPISNTVKVKVQKKVIYTKIQLTNSDTGKVEFIKNVGENQNVIDLSALNSGNYIMILTDDEKNIYTDKFSIY